MIKNLYIHSVKDTIGDSIRCFHGCNDTAIRKSLQSLQSVKLKNIYVDEDTNIFEVLYSLHKSFYYKKKNKWFPLEKFYDINRFKQYISSLLNQKIHIFRTNFATFPLIDIYLGYTTILKDLSFVTEYNRDKEFKIMQKKKENLCCIS